MIGTDGRSNLKAVATAVHEFITADRHHCLPKLCLHQRTAIDLCAASGPIEYSINPGLADRYIGVDIQFDNSMKRGEFRLEREKL
jgi:hypothetical protein